MLRQGHRRNAHVDDAAEICSEINAICLDLGWITASAIHEEPSSTVECHGEWPMG